MSNLINQLNAIEKAKTYKEQTIITVESDTKNNAQMQVKLVAYKDFMQDFESRISALENA